MSEPVVHQPQRVRCWAWYPGTEFGKWCQCGHLDVAHSRDGVCGVCEVQASAEGLDAAIREATAAVETFTAQARQGNVRHVHFGRWRRRR